MLILHHTSRDEPTRFSGTEQIKAASEEMWLYYPPELLNWKKSEGRPTIGPVRHLVLEKSRTGLQGKTLIVTRNAFRGEWTFRQPPSNNDNPMERLSNVFRGWCTDDEWRIASEWRKVLELPFSGRSLRRYLDALDGIVLESCKIRGRVTGRVETHYRPRAVIRDAAKAMKSSDGEGVNVI